MSELSKQGADQDVVRRAALEAEADRYLRQRQQQADLLVAKARRLLVAAEEKAAVIVATARVRAERLADPQAAGDEVIDLDALADGAAPAREHPTEPAALTALDRMLASAIASAVEHAFSGDGHA